MLELIKFLLCCLVGRIDLASAKKFVECSGKITACAQHTAPVNVAHSSLESHSLKVRLVGQVLRLLQRGLPVILVGGVKVLARLCVLTALGPLFGRLTMRGY